MDREFHGILSQNCMKSVHHSEGLTTLYKLKYEHVNLTSFPK